MTDSTSQSDTPDGFLSRWSRRKLDVQSGKPVAEPAPAAVITATPDRPPSPSSDLAVQAPHGAGPDDASKPAPPPLPTLADAQALTKDSDFKPFMARGVAADVKNAAMKKLFADPHFNVMDRLDTYIDDYSLADPIPESMLRQMASAKFLNLFDDEDKPKALRDDADTTGPQVVAQSSAPDSLIETPLNTTAHDHPDLRLQPHHAAEPSSPGGGAA
jgi:hypothetical protein